jgi:cytochrome b involved in lipid metabolism
MNKNILPIGVGIIIIVIIAAVFLTRPKKNDEIVPVAPETSTTETTGANAATSTTGTVSTGTGSGEPAPSSYTLAEVSKHNGQTSCWTAINGNVYDVTSWISRHPGGSDAILSLCGTDGSAAFTGQHGGQARPASELATFKIGTLKQ